MIASAYTYGAVIVSFLFTARIIDCPQQLATASASSRLDAVRHGAEIVVLSLLCIACQCLGFVSPILAFISH
jgi:hypothetical protein